MGILALKCTSTHGFHQKFKSLLRAIDLTLLMYVEEQCNHWSTNLPSSWLNLKTGVNFLHAKNPEFSQKFQDEIHPKWSCFMLKVPAAAGSQLLFWTLIIHPLTSLIFIFFWSRKPRNKVRILIYRKWPIILKNLRWNSEIMLLYYFFDVSMFQAEKPVCCSAWDNLCWKLIFIVFVKLLWGNTKFNKQNKS